MDRRGDRKARVRGESDVRRVAGGGGSYPSPKPDPHIDAILWHGTAALTGGELTGWLPIRLDEVKIPVHTGDGWATLVYIPSPVTARQMGMTWMEYQLDRVV